MLVLSRRVQQRIVIGEGIEITVLHVSGNRVRLGIECDRDIPIRRRELPLLVKDDPQGRQQLLAAAHIQ